MDKQSRGKKTLIFIVTVIVFIVTVIVLAIIFSFVYWLIGLIFHGDSTFDWTTLIQGLIFALIYVPLARYMRKKRSQTPSTKKQ